MKREKKTYEGSEDPHRYDDMLDLPHPDPKTHPRMSRTARAAQFSPFAALTGYESAVRETADRAAWEVAQEVEKEELYIP